MGITTTRYLWKWNWFLVIKTIFLWGFVLRNSGSFTFQVGSLTLIAYYEIPDVLVIRAAGDLTFFVYPVSFDSEYDDSSLTGNDSFRRHQLFGHGKHIKKMERS